MNILSENADIADMSPITRKLDIFLISEDFSFLGAGRIVGGHGRYVNQLEYIRGEGERVFITTHEPPEGDTTEGDAEEWETA
jgi:hypothetical protein